MESATPTNITRGQPGRETEPNQTSATGSKIKRKIPKESDNISSKKLAISGEVSSMEKALGMGETLEAIFTHLPTKFLLSSCSLVNKFWNTEARTFIRDHRICTFDKPRCNTACEMLRKLDGICGEIIEEGRVIPFNCLNIRFSGSCFLDYSSDEDTCSSDEEDFGGIEENSGEVQENFGGVQENSGGVQENSGDVLVNSASIHGNSGDVQETSGGVQEYSYVFEDNAGPWEDSSSDEDNCSTNEIPLTNIANNFKLRYLEIDGPDCNYHRPLDTLLKYSSGQLRRLTSGSTYPYKRLKTAEWHPRFPRLEDFSIKYTCPEELILNARVKLEHESEGTQKDILRWVLKDAPNLKRIYVGVPDLLHIVPKEFFPGVELQSGIDIHLYSKKSMDRFVKFLRTRIRLTHVRIFESSSSPCDPLKEEHVDENLRRRFDFSMELALRKLHQRLKVIEIIGVYQLANLSHPPLTNLSKLTITLWEKCRLDELWDAIVSINFERAMPSLEAVGIAIRNLSPIVHDEDVFNEWPIANNALLCRHCNGDIIYRSNTVRKLKLDLHVKKINLQPLQVLFPNVSILHLHLNGYKFSDRTRDFAPLEEIWVCWPQLEELKFFGQNNFLNRNYDSDFCGIYQEEANLLRHKGIEYLRNVHIIPIKPCLLTMPKLCTAWFEEGFFIQAEDSPHTFTSNLTQFVAFERMPQLDCSQG